METLEQKIIQLDNNIKEFKASQIIGDSSSKIYTILDNFPMTISLPADSGTNIRVSFTGMRKFPHMMVKVGGASASSIEYLFQKYNFGIMDDSESYKCQIIIYLPYVYSATTFSLTITIYADCLGEYKIETGDFW